MRCSKRGGRRHRSRSRRRWKSLIKFPVRMFHGPTITRRQFGYTVVGQRFSTPFAGARSVVGGGGGSKKKQKSES